MWLLRRITRNAGHAAPPAAGIHATTPLFDIAERERVPKVPAHGAKNQLGLGLSPLEDRRSDCLLYDLFRLPAAVGQSCNTTDRHPLVASDVAFGFFMPFLGIVDGSFRAVPLGQIGCHPPTKHGLRNLAEGNRIDFVNLHLLS